MSSNALILIFTVSFVSVVDKALEPFACATNPDGSYLMQADPNIECRSTVWWRNYAVPALLWLTAYITLPLWLTLQLARSGDTGRWAGERFTFRAFAAFYRKYKRAVYAWELWVLVRKFVLVASVVLFNLYPLRAWYVCYVLILHPFVFPSFLTS
jgi:hypothetical protein